VGTATEFTAQQLTDHFKGEIESKTKTAVLQYMLAQGIGIKSVNACLAPLSDALKAVMSPFWEKFGFSLEGFYVTSIEVDNEGEAGKRILEAMGRQSAQLIAGYSYQQDRAFDNADDAAKHGSGGLLGAVMMTNLLGGAGNLIPPPAPVLPGTGTTTASGVSPGVGAPRRVFCSQCARQFSSDTKFCPHCGHSYTPCPRCGTDNDKETSRCVNCGITLSTPALGDTCRRCQAPISGHVTFCPNCGDRVTY
jgi:membrane protease subunit (stomatin/prohibitin family)